MLRPTAVYHRPTPEAAAGQVAIVPEIDAKRYVAEWPEQWSLEPWPDVEQVWPKLGGVGANAPIDARTLDLLENNFAGYLYYDVPVPA